MKEKIKAVVYSRLFASACSITIGLVLLMEKHPFYAGIAFGFAGCKFLDAFKKL